MSAYDDAFHVMQDSRWLRLKRDIRLAYWLAKFVFRYLTTGWAVRREYNKLKRAGQPFYMN